MKNEIKVVPRDIYVDYGKHNTRILTSTREMFSINSGDVVYVANQIRNLVSYILINKKTGEQTQLQNIRVSIDTTGYGMALKDTLESLGIKCEDITHGTWLRDLCDSQDVVHAEDRDYRFRQKINDYKLL